MRSFKKGVVAFLLALLVLGSAGDAMSSSFWPIATTAMKLEAVSRDYTFYYDTSPYYITPVGFNSSAKVTMIDLTTPYPHETLFTNQNLASEFGQVKLVSIHDVGLRTPNNGYYGLDFGNNDFVRGKLLESLALNANGKEVSLPVGTILIGLGIHASMTGDRTFDDFVFAVSTTSPTVTPIPGAVWLLGSGLVGLAGFKRSRRSQG